MPINTDFDADLSLMIPQIIKVRDAIKGAPVVKSKAETYLPNPDVTDRKNTDSGRAAYLKYLMGAEFEPWVSQTQQSMIGRLNLTDVKAELNQLDYLLSDCDGDGLSLAGSIEQAAKDILVAGWRIGVVDYEGLTEADLQDVSLADVKMMLSSSRPKIKTYNRESVVKRHFSVINGRKQLSMIMFYEQGEVINQETFRKEVAESFLILALDENGDYYQQKIVKGTKNAEGEREHILVAGSPLKFIPAVIISDHEVEHELPQKLGFLSPIADKCYHRYGVSAAYAFYLDKLVPTINVYLDRTFSLEDFAELNGGSQDYAQGGVNVFVGESRVETTSAENNVKAFQEKLLINESEARSIGAVIPKKDQSDNTATQAFINLSEQNSILKPLVMNLESSYKWLIAYCAMFEGLVSQENISDYVAYIDLSLPMEFTDKQKRPEFVASVINLFSSGLATRKQAVKMLIDEGFHDGEADQILSELEDSI